jgi:hypothetical protein
MTYTELVAAIQSYTENYEQEFVSYIPTFIRQTETRVYNTVQIPALRRNQTGTLTCKQQVSVSARRLPVGVLDGRYPELRHCRMRPTRTCWTKM